MVLAEITGESHEFAPLFDCNNQWIDGELTTTDGRFILKVLGKTLKLQLSTDLTKQISDSNLFGFKTSVVIDQFIPDHLGSIDVIELGKQPLVFLFPEKEKVFPEKLMNFMKYIVATFATSSAEAPTRIEQGHRTVVQLILNVLQKII